MPINEGYRKDNVNDLNDDYEDKFDDKKVNVSKEK